MKVIVSLRTNTSVNSGRDYERLTNDWEEDDEQTIRNNNNNE